MNDAAAESTPLQPLWDVNTATQSDMSALDLGNELLPVDIIGQEGVDIPPDDMDAMPYLVKPPASGDAEYAGEPEDRRLQVQDKDGLVSGRFVVDDWGITAAVDSITAATSDQRHTLLSEFMAQAANGGATAIELSGRGEEIVHTLDGLSVNVLTMTPDDDFRQWRVRIGLSSPEVPEPAATPEDAFDSRPDDDAAEEIQVQHETGALAEGYITVEAGKRLAVLDNLQVSPSDMDDGPTSVLKEFLYRAIEEGADGVVANVIDPRVLELLADAVGADALRYTSVSEYDFLRSPVDESYDEVLQRLRRLEQLVAGHSDTARPVPHDMKGVRVHIQMTDEIIDQFGA